MALRTEYHQDASGQTLYAYPAVDSADDWHSTRVIGRESINGQYKFVLDDVLATHWWVIAEDSVATDATDATDATEAIGEILIAMGSSADAMLSTYGTMQDRSVAMILPQKPLHSLLRPVAIPNPKPPKNDGAGAMATVGNEGIPF